MTTSLAAVTPITGAASRGADRERQRLARDLQDRVAPYVLSAGMAVEVARREAEAAGGPRGEVHERLETAAALSREAVDQLLRTIQALRHSVDVEEDVPTTADGLLTEREAEVLALMARGLSNKQIGARLFISETTVKFHVGNILRKLEVTRRAEAVYEAHRLGLIRAR